MAGNTDNINNGYRTTFLVFKYENHLQNLVSFQQDSICQKNKDMIDQQHFFTQYKFDAPRTDVVGSDAITCISSALQYWAEYGSFYTCENCHSIVSVKMPYNFVKRPTVSKKTKCQCVKQRYIVPRINDFPYQLLHLSKECIHALRPFDIHCGNYKREKHGYRVKTTMIDLWPSTKPILEKIRDLNNHNDRQKCRVAYEYLMSSNESSYAHFVNLRQEILENESTLNPFNFSLTVGIECALWPNLYPFTSWCESTLSGKQTRLSGKVSFCAKLFSEIADYALHFDLLQWQYDRALYKVVSGAINTARFSKCSPARALDSKSFSETYWQWQHKYLLDAIDQFGLPDAFITISPYEWSFPFAKWVSSIRQSTGMGPTRLPAYETYNITHTLEQIVRGYFCGSTSQKWTEHLFSYNKLSNYKNVKTFFYRFEFQQRRTVHLHMLVWLKNPAQTQHQFLRADIPSTHPHLAYLVHKLQQSDKRSHCLQLQYEESFFRFENGKQVHHLKHPAEEFALNLRAYIATVLPALKCRMDYQTTDGVAMLLRYVTSYVCKSQDTTTIDSMYSYDLEGRQAAVRYLMCNMPAEPEMCLFLFSKKVAWTSSRTKRYLVPTSENAASDKTVLKYWKREKQYDHLTMINWLRCFDTKKPNPKPYKNGSTLVGKKILSIFNTEHFFQYVLLHFPHRDIEALHHPNHDQLPSQLHWYAAPAYHFPDLWNNEASLKSFLLTQGHRDFYIETILSHIASLHDLLHLVQMQIISKKQLATVELCQSHDFSLDAYQLVRHLDTALHLRHISYNNNFPSQSQEKCTDSNPSDTDSEVDSDWDDDSHMQNLHNEPCFLSNDIQWQQPVLVMGKPGAGKTEAICHCVRKVNSNGLNVLIAAQLVFLLVVSALSYLTMLFVTQYILYFTFLLILVNILPPIGQFRIMTYSSLMKYQ